jgi:hypothetical protein
LSAGSNGVCRKSKDMSVFDVSESETDEPVAVNGVRGPSLWDSGHNLEKEQLPDAVQVVNLVVTDGEDKGCRGDLVDEGRVEVNGRHGAASSKQLQDRDSIGSSEAEIERRETKCMMRAKLRKILVKNSDFLQQMRFVGDEVMALEDDIIINMGENDDEDLEAKARDLEEKLHDFASMSKDLTAEVGGLADCGILSAKPEVSRKGLNCGLVKNCVDGENEEVQSNEVDCDECDSSNIHQSFGMHKELSDETGKEAKLKRVTESESGLEMNQGHLANLSVGEDSQSDLRGGLSGGVGGATKGDRIGMSENDCFGQGADKDDKVKTSVGEDRQSDLRGGLSRGATEGDRIGMSEQDCLDQGTDKEDKVKTSINMKRKSEQKMVGRKKRKALGCEQTIESGIEEIADNGETGGGGRGVGYGLRKRCHRDLNAVFGVTRYCCTGTRNRGCIRSVGKSEPKSSSTNVTTVAEIHAVLDENQCKDNHFDVKTDEELRQMAGTVVKIDETVRSKESGEVSERVNIKDDTRSGLGHYSIDDEIVEIGSGDADRELEKRVRKTEDAGCDVPNVCGAEETSNKPKPRRRSRQSGRLKNGVQTLEGGEPSSKSSKNDVPESSGVADGDEVHKRCHEEEEGQETKDGTPKVLPPLSDSTLVQGLGLTEELMTPVTNSAPAHAENVQLVTPVVDIRLTEWINGQAQLDPKKGRGNPNVELMTPMMDNTSAHGNNQELVTPMTDVRLIEEIKHQVQLAPKKGRNDPNAEMVTTMIDTMPTHSKDHELITLMTDVSLIEEIKHQVQLAPKKGRYAEMPDVGLIEEIKKQVQLAPKKGIGDPDGQEEDQEFHILGSDGDKIVGSFYPDNGEGNQRNQTDSANAMRKLWEETKQDTDGIKEDSEGTIEYEAKEQCLQTPESVVFIPKESNADMSSFEPSQESNCSSVLHSEHLDSFSLDPCDIFESSSPDDQDVTAMKQTTDFRVAQAVRKMQMIGTISPASLISPISSVMSASLSGVGQVRHH